MRKSELLPVVDDGPFPLIGERKRQATDSMRGYSYQMLRSIETWLDLRDGEVLALEGAEDLDRISSAGAVVEQVKDTAASITLRSANVLDAIANFWNHLGRNPGVPLRFRYLTTASVGLEKGRPFNLDEPGLAIWCRIAATPSAANSLQDAGAIQTFLKDQDALPDDLRRWLGDVEAGEFVSSIIQPMEWVTGWREWSDLLADIEAKLAEFCESRSLGAAAAAPALQALHMEAWRAAVTKGARLLRRGDLLRIVNAAGSTMVPTAQLLDMIRAISGGVPTNVTASNVALGGPPRPAPRRHVRADLEFAISEASDVGTILIHGATGMGKTALAIATLRAECSTAWIDLREMSPAAAATRIDAIAEELNRLARTFDVVLDDLPIAGDVRSLAGALGRLRLAQDRLCGRLIVTAADRPPPRLTSQLNLRMLSIIVAPPFSLEDIEGYLISRGCPIELAADWSKILLATTSGHPQLVDARVAALADADFPTANVAELLVAPPEIIDVRDEARRIVAARHCDDRELLARASLLLGRTPRRRLIAIAGLASAIVEPGDVIDRLTGPWLERTESDDLRVSPLLRDLGLETRGREWVVGMNRGIASAFLADRTIAASDVFQLATHAMLGRSAASLVALLPSLLQAPPDVWTQIAETASMLPLFAVGKGMTSPFPDPTDTAAFRLLQVRIAVEIGKNEQVEELLDQALGEFDALEPEPVLGANLFQVVLLWQVLLRPGCLQPARRLALALRFGRVSRRIATETEEGFFTRDGVHVKRDDLSWPDLSALIPMILIPDVTDADGLIALLDLIDGLGPEDRAAALGGFSGDGEAAALALDRAWIGEARRDTPRWSELAAALRRTADIDVAGSTGLAEAAGALLVRVTDENLGDLKAALALADGLISGVLRPPRILAAKARILTRHSRAAEALPLYDEAIARFPFGLSWRTDVLRDASVAAGRAGDWAVAAERLRTAVDRMESGEPMEICEPIERRVGFDFDLAIALHLAGRTRDAVDVLGRATDLLVEDDRQHPPEPLLSVRQIGSQVVKAITNHLEGDSADVSQGVDLGNIFGLASGLHELQWDGQPAANLDLFVLIMVGLDLLMPEPPLIATRLAGRLRAATDLLAQSVQGDPLARLAALTMDVEEGAADAVREARAVSFAAAERDAGRGGTDRMLAEAPPTPPAATQELIKFRLLVGILPFVEQRRPGDLPINRWLTDLPSGSAFAETRAMLEDLGRMIDGSERAAPRILSGNITWDRHLLAGLMAPLQDTISPEDLLVCHVVASQYLGQPGLRERSALPWSKIVTQDWLERCESPASLVAPRLTVPAIRNAAAQALQGWPRIVAVLRAAAGAVRSNSAATVAHILQDLGQR